jgi:hypothetical protein
MDVLSVLSGGIRPPNATSIIIIAVLNTVAVILSLVVPGPLFKGAPLKNNKPSILYKMNGLAVNLIAILLFIVGSNYVLGLYKITIIYDNYGALLSTSLIYAVLLNTFLYLRATFFIPKVCSSFSHSHFRQNKTTRAQTSLLIIGAESNSILTFLALKSSFGRIVLHSFYSHASTSPYLLISSKSMVH